MGPHFAVMLPNRRGSVGDLECRTALGAGPPVIVDARRGDVGVTEPFLHLGDVGLALVAAVARSACAQSFAVKKGRAGTVTTRKGLVYENAKLSKNMLFIAGIDGAWFAALAQFLL